MKNQDISDSVVLGFDIFLNQVRKMSNADFLIAIDNVDNADAVFTKTSKVQISNDKDAPKYQLTEEQISDLYPYTYDDVVYTCKSLYTDCSINSRFHSIMRKAKKDKNLSFGRKLDPRSQGKPDKYFYSDRIFDFLDEYYTLKAVENQKQE